MTVMKDLNPNPYDREPAPFIAYIGISALLAIPVLIVLVFLGLLGAL
jgi:hypothetical protein